MRRVITVATLLIAGCGGDESVDPGPPVDPDVLRVLAAPEDTSLYVGRTFQLRAHLVDSTGTQFPNDRFDYEALDDLTSVSGDGVVTGEATGRARVLVRRGTVGDTVLVSVVPDGVIAFNWITRDERLAVTGLDGSVIWVSAPADMGASTWLADGRLVQQRQSYPLPPLLYTVSQDGSSVTTFFPVPPILDAKAERSPRASRDGQWVYFAQQEEGLRRVHPDGTGLESVTNISAGAPDPSPDGTRLVFSRGFVSPVNLPIVRPIVRDLATGVEQEFDLGESSGFMPRWSPDGQWIAYIKDFDGADRDAIYVARPDGSEERRVSREGDRFEGFGLDWSPDGAWLVTYHSDGLALVEVGTGLLLPLRWAVHGSSYPTFRR